MNRQDRLNRLQGELQLRGLSAYLVQDPIDLYYLTGLKMSAGQLFVPQLGQPALMVDDRYLERARAVMPAFRASSQMRQNWLCRVGSAQSNAQDSSGASAKIGFDSAFVSVQSHQKLIQECQDLPQSAKYWTWSAQPLLVQSLRSCKDKEEIELLSRAAQLGAAGIDFTLSQLVQGITERQLARDLEIFWLQQGAMGAAFPPNISFGANSSRPHHVSGERALQWGDLVLIDIGVRLDHYCSDITRSLFFADEQQQLPSDLVSVWHSVTNALKSALSICCAGVSIDELDAAARDVLREDGYEEKFTHGLGHGVGLQVHELPKLSKDGLQGQAILKEGQIITLEPGVYLEARGGVRQEEMVIVEKGGCRPLAARPFPLVCKGAAHR